MKFREAFQDRVWTISNFLSVSRILLLPLFFYLSYRYTESPYRMDYMVWLLVLVLVAILTDFLDGFLARKLNQESMLGQYLDPVADKLVSFSALTVLVVYFTFPLWVYAIFILREVFGVWGGSFLYFKRDLQGKPNIWGKLSVGMIGISTFWYIILPYLKTILKSESYGLKAHYSAYLLVALLVLSVVEYIRTYRHIIFRKEEDKQHKST